MNMIEKSQTFFILAAVGLGLFEQHEQSLFGRSIPKKSTEIDTTKFDVLEKRQLQRINRTNKFR